MIIQFRFRNYKSFRDEVVLDFTSTKSQENISHVVETGNLRLLPVIAIFGANASGKSNILSAFAFMRKYVLNSFGYSGIDNGTPSSGTIRKPKLSPFMFDSVSAGEPTLFEVTYISDADNKFITYRYGFELTADGIVKEWLDSRSRTSRDFRSVLRREGDVIDMKDDQSLNLITAALDHNTLFLSLAAKLKMTPYEGIWKWFSSVEFANYGNPYENLYRSTYLPENFANDEEVRYNTVRFLSAFDSGIKGFNVQEVKVPNSEDVKLRVDTMHKCSGSEELVAIPLSEESAGTQKMLSLYPEILIAMNTGGVLCIDEFDAKLHPLLVASIVEAFADSSINIKNAQLIFTTHEPWILSNDVLRRDEVWFTEKQEDENSILYSLAGYETEEGCKIRNDENHVKNYIQGKYGAIPDVKSFKGLI